MAIGGVLLIWTSSFSTQRIESSQKCSFALNIDSTFIENPISLAKSVNIRLRNKEEIDLTGMKASILYTDSSKNLEGIPLDVENNRVLIPVKSPLQSGEATNAVVDVTDKGYPSKIEVVSSECPTNPVTQILVSTTSVDNDFFDKYKAAYWKFDEGNGLTISGSPNGTCSGMGASCNWVQGKSKYGINFDGVDDHIEVNDEDSLDISGNQATLEAWVKWAGPTANGSQRVIDKEGPAGTGYALWINNAGQVTVRWNSDALIQYTSSTSVNINDWSYVVVTYNGTTTKIFIDNAQRGSGSATFSIGINTNKLYIGNRAAQDRSFNGTIDEVRILNISRIM